VRLRELIGAGGEAVVVVDEPHGDIYGGSVAAPAFGRIAQFALPYLGIPAE
jgi:hypothetical protein